MTVSVGILIHGPIFAAKAGKTLGAPLNLQFSGEYGLQEVTFFCESAALTRDLADAINAVIAKHAAEDAARDESASSLGLAAAHIEPAPRRMLAALEAATGA
ncbi:hypothetical protein SAMN05519103_00316 [Rhizobiales bacterium GAS113]|nr:hypothetical protein SAMN05519103_00316 [Rhizobiales bacterium GAS113]